MINSSLSPTASRVHALAAMVAVHDGEAGRAAIRVASALAAAGRIVPQVIVVDPATPAGPTPTRIDSQHGAQSRHMPGEISEHMADIRAVAGAAGGGRWPIWLRSGDPAHEIVHYAIHGQFQLVVMGLRHLDAVDRRAEHDVTPSVARLSQVPVFGVVFWLHHLPRRIVVGVDFSPSSLRSADTACRILADGGTLILAYATSPFEKDAARVVRVHPRSVQAELASLIRRLPLPANAHVETAPVFGSPVTELLNMADRVSADAIAVGRQHHSLAARARFGSVSAGLIRDARCSVLVTPPLSS
jgi:nucleotide-binding universal stress UspA family protein